jgi:predicted nucleic acid-binding protein
MQLADTSAWQLSRRRPDLQASFTQKTVEGLIAAAAESAGVELLHYDEDFDRIAAITGQPMRWIVPRGSL